MSPRCRSRSEWHRGLGVTSVRGVRISVMERTHKLGPDMIGGLSIAHLQRRQALPVRMSLTEGCRLKRDIPKDGAITYDDLELPEGRMCDRLRVEQEAYYAQR